LQDAIDNGEVPAFDNFTKESKSKRNKRTRRFKREACEASKLKEKLNLGKLLFSPDLVARHKQ